MIDEFGGNKMNDTIYWNVDTQNDFMRSDESFNGALPVPGARGIEKKLEELTSYARDNNIRVVNTKDWHNADSAEFSESPDYMTSFPPHCLAGTKGAEYVPATAPDDPYVVGWEEGSAFDVDEMLKHRNVTICKDAFDVFEGNSRTDKIVAAIAPARAVVYGVATNVCVDYAVSGLLARGVDVYVPLDAIKELPGLPLDATLDKWKSLGAKLCTVETLDSLLNNSEVRL